MELRPYRLAVLAVYQLTVIAGICLLPVAILAQRAGLRMPLHRVVDRLGTAYDRTA